ncbi:hypothetical protein DSO57_1009358 [Entomophthora muscae]|uniref:Uncharacterized protein n=1 Tax=Entomophthora muscae TaxID=34485 RepID=A0ACC2TU95_9FUNG|nr:hypothetical protein DSO57_1009358 [Entomophthora muscae]
MIPFDFLLHQLDHETLHYSSQEAPLLTTPSLNQWRAKAQEIEHKQIEGGTKHLESRYAVGDPVYTLNPNSAKLDPNHLGPFKVAVVYDNHTYQLKDAQGNTKKLHIIACAPAMPSPHKGRLCGPSQIFHRLQSWCLTQARGKGGVATEVQTLPANISYNTQGALDESPLDVSNNMNQSDGNIKLRALHPN